MQYCEQPIGHGFYWFKRPPYTKGFWWQKKTTITPGWEMCYVNKTGMAGDFAVVVGSGTKLLSFKADVEWYGPIPHPENLDFLMTSAINLKELQKRNFERVSTD